MVLERVADLDISCASGIVEHDGRLYVISDDRFELAVFGDPSEPAEWLSLADEPLPADPAARKAAKPDLEALALLPDGLLALGSGATARRERGWIVRFDGDRVEKVPLGPIYEELRRELADLNIEGAALEADALWLAQRGNGADGVNALVELDPAAFPAAGSLRSITPFELGEAGGVRLSFSDLAPLGDGRLAFCCIAEAGQSTYHDGPLAAAGVGVLDTGTRTVERIEMLREPFKIEGVTPRGDGTLLLVADPDDASVASPLLAGTLASP